MHCELFAGATKPASHGVQLLTLPPDTTLPPGHVNAAHAEAPTLAAVVPLGQTLQAAKPVALAYVPGVHGSQSVAP